MKNFTLNKLIVLGVAVLLGLFTSGKSFAQTAPAFQFKLQAFDALTHGVVTTQTTQIVYGIVATNNTATNYVVTFVPTMELLVNIPQDGNGLADTVTPAPIQHFLPLNAFSTQLVYIANSPTNNVDVITLKNVSFTHSLWGQVMFNFSYTSPGGTPQVLTGISASDVVYKPSNNDLLPLVVTNQNTATSQISNIQRVLINIYTTVTDIWSSLGQYVRRDPTPRATS